MSQHRRVHRVQTEYMCDVTIGVFTKNELDSKVG